MWLALLCSWCRARKYVIGNETIAHVVLNNDGEVEIQPGPISVWLRLDPHFIYGELSITVVNAKGTRYNIEGRAGDRFFYTHSSVTIAYRKASAPTKVFLWVLRDRVCSYMSVHSRGQRSATIALANTTSSMMPFCYFLEFEMPAQLRVTNAPSTFPGFPSVEIIEPGTKAVDNASVAYPLSRVFVVRIGQISGGLPLAMRIDSLAAGADGSNREGAFLDCTSDPADCTVPNVETLGFAADRAFARWLSAAIGLALVVVVAVVGLLLFGGAFDLDAGLDLNVTALASVTV